MANNRDDGSDYRFDDTLAAFNKIPIPADVFAFPYQDTDWDKFLADLPDPETKELLQQESQEPQRQPGTQEENEVQELVEPEPQRPETDDPRPPNHIYQHILRLGGRGTHIQFVIEKKLGANDTAKHENRVTLPSSKIKEFLTENEKTLIMDQGKYIEVQVVDPRLEEQPCHLSFRKSSKSLCLKNGWNNIIVANQLNDGQNIQIWSFRVDGKLYLAFWIRQHVSVPREDDSVSAQGG